MYTGPKLIQLLEKQHQHRGLSNLFKKGTFTLSWRTKVGSFPHPDIETIVSVGEPCGEWRSPQGRPEDKRQVGENWEQMPELPLNGYIPASSIRGIVRAWAKERPAIHERMQELLGYQNGQNIYPGKIEFLDAWPEEPTKLVLDIVNPQQNFQVYHEGQGKPLSLYTLGNGEEPITVTVAIRGIPGRASNQDVETVWEWVQQALNDFGIGSRTAAGYGSIKAPSTFKPSGELRQIQNGYASKEFEFTLYSQGCAGPDTRTMEFRPSHWRGWLRSWILRFMLGVMSRDSAEDVLNQLMGTLESPTRNGSIKGCVRLSIKQGEDWGKRSHNSPYFYKWSGKLKITAPKEILNNILLPIIKFAVSVGGVGRGWRRPLHIFHMNNGNQAARGSQLILTHQLLNNRTQKREIKRFGLPLDSQKWHQAYENWLDSVRQQWADEINIGQNQQLEAEVFSPLTCAIYAVPGPDTNPVNSKDIDWLETNARNTRGDGMDLIYQPTFPRNYKRNPDLGGNAANNGNPSCSWASIRRVNIPNQEEDTECQEIVCLFMGGKTPQSNHVRSRFLKDLSQMDGAVHLFGVSP